MKAIILILKKGTADCEKCCEMKAFETFCHFARLIELPIATHNILQENIDLTLSLLVTLSNVVIVWVWCKNKQKDQIGPSDMNCKCPTKALLLLSHKRAAALNCHIRVAREDHLKSSDALKTWSMKLWNIQKMRQECATCFLYKWISDFVIN